MGQKIARAVTAAAIAAALIIAHRAANWRFFALTGHAASHDVAAQFYSGTLKGDQSGKGSRDPTLHVVGSQAVNAVTDLVSSGPMVGAGDAQPSVIFPPIARIGGVQVAVEHERRTVTLAAHNADDVGPSFFYFLQMRLNPGFTHVSVKKARTLELL